MSNIIEIRLLLRRLALPSLVALRWWSLVAADAVGSPPPPPPLDGAVGAA